MPAGSRPRPASPSLGVKAAWGGVLPLPSLRLGQLWGVGRQQVDWASRSVPRWDPGHSASPDPQPTTLTLLRPGGLHSRLAAYCPGDSCLGDPPQRSPPEPTLPAEAWPELGTEASVAASGPFPGPAAWSRASGPLLRPGCVAQLPAVPVRSCTWGRAPSPGCRGGFGACLALLQPHCLLHCLSPSPPSPSSSCPPGWPPT